MEEKPENLSKDHPMGIGRVQGCVASVFVLFLGGSLVAWEMGREQNR